VNYEEIDLTEEDEFVNLENSLIDPSSFFLSLQKYCETTYKDIYIGSRAIKYEMLKIFFTKTLLVVL
jgi:hypothetical protein